MFVESVLSCSHNCETQMDSTTFHVVCGGGGVTTWTQSTVAKEERTAKVIATLALSDLLGHTTNLQTLGLRGCNIDLSFNLKDDELSIDLDGCGDFSVNLRTYAHKNSGRRFLHFIVRGHDLYYCGLRAKEKTWHFNFKDSSVDDCDVVVEQWWCWDVEAPTPADAPSGTASSGVPSASGAAGAVSCDAEPVETASACAEIADAVAVLDLSA